MAITSISINQDNFVGSSDLLPVHSPLVFLVDVNYTDAVPDVLNVEIRDEDNNILEEYRAIPYLDPLTTQRQFAFRADLPIRSLMEEFDDFFQNVNTLEFVEDITKIFKVRFIDPEDKNIYDELTATFIHGAAQFGENPNKSDIFNNVSTTYYGSVDGFTYVYYYNSDTINNLSVTVS